ncbi:MAG TPA: hypothetical protein GXX39_06445 [Syntrophothermus lipocalidus]|mgnify:CR=1 FL=1|uniref:Uncharacterized protein n=1 Tax=Syntrophothermus lipocalidus (strain DSM 12680 / TGB-C1) TaxID=643648 RepID=D7CLK4_SYNLT|nr:MULTISPECIES: hypothetical protein [Syntrophothermus]ADI01589.1 hypothetical protein Slip_0809 [Syntrophothermus lipocalidus DSM 12680]NSW83961.1 hypothetical protein [Syntrophothermus sp.]HHV76986.1 hypothetical protein [Syntrophothermus lipocalidus]
MTRQLLALLIVAAMLFLVIPLAVYYWRNEEAFSPYNLIQTHVTADNALHLQRYC